jgi:Ni2+-binding GTPase involved in maturation of urease and hydrogenase
MERGSPLDALDLVVIENAGNLVRPAEFDVGQHARAIVFAITEGEEKPPKSRCIPHRRRGYGDPGQRPRR